jgi:serine/threonine-protein kinase RsbT
VGAERISTNIDPQVAAEAAETQEVVLQESHIGIQTDLDIIVARKEGRTLSAQLGFSSTDLTFIATAISELARNIITYAGLGEIEIQLVQRGGRKGVVITARDKGPGIPDVRQALQEGFSTSRSLGLGLPGIRRLMDEFEIDSALGQGTTVKLRKWKS